MLESSCLQDLGQCLSVSPIRLLVGGGGSRLWCNTEHASVSFDVHNVFFIFISLLRSQLNRSFAEIMQPVQNGSRCALGLYIIYIYIDGYSMAQGMHRVVL